MKRGPRRGGNVLTDSLSQMRTCLQCGYVDYDPLLVDPPVKETADAAIRRPNDSED